MFRTSPPFVQGIQPQYRPFARSGGGSFVPTDIAGCMLWLDASQIVGLNDGDPVATWGDESGNGNDATQGTSGSRPTYQTNELNGLPIVSFDGSDDFMAGSLVISSGDISVFLVSLRTSGNGCFVDVSPDGGANFNGFIHYSESGTDTPVVNGGGGLSYSNISTVWQYKGTRHTTNARDTFLNSVSQDSDVSSVSLVTTSVYRIGRFYFADLYPLNGGLAEVIIYNSSVTNPQKSQLDTYIATKYGF